MASPGGCTWVHKHPVHMYTHPATEEEGKEVSLCSYCSDSHAGVRWAVHPSVNGDYPYVLEISFQHTKHGNCLMFLFNTSTTVCRPALNIKH